MNFLSLTRRLSFAMALFLAPPLWADGLMTYIYHPPESKTDQRYLYHWEILRTALEKTTERYGPYELKASEVMTEKRQAMELKAATGKLTVMYLGTTPDFEKNLIPIRIPVDRNLGGYSLFLIRKDHQKRFDAVRTLEDLRPFSYGLGLGWVDVEILQSNGLKVVTGSSYDGLFEMLVHRRFDVFLRAAIEISAEYEEHRDRMPELAIEENVILYYPLPMYFWFPKTEEGRLLAKRAEEGMWAMIEDGTYRRIFDQFQRDKILKLKLKERRIFKINNPLLGPETPFNDKRWFDPATYE